MKIWIIKTGEQTELDNNARLLRSGQIFENLKKENYDITWFNSTFNHQIKKQRFFKTTILKKKKTKIIYLYGNSYKNNISLSRFFSQLLNAIEFFKYVKNAKFAKPDLIISSYPTAELSFISCFYAKSKKVPYILDVRDMWPDIIFSNLNYFKKFLFLPVFIFWNIIFKYCINNSQSIISISENFLSWTLKKGDISKNKNHKYFYLTKPLNNRTNKLNNHKISKIYKKHSHYIKIIYCGSVSKRHDFISFFKALENIKNKKICLYICGKGVFYEELKNKFRNSKKLFFIGWVNNNELNYLLSKCDYGLLPYKSKDFKMSYPNKISEYLSNNLKIITCTDGLTKKLIIRKKIGYYYKYKSEISVFNILQKIKKNNDQNSFNVYKKMFDYNFIMKNMINHFKKIIVQHKLNIL